MSEKSVAKLVYFFSDRCKYVTSCCTNHRPRLNHLPELKVGAGGGVQA